MAPDYSQKGGSSIVREDTVGLKANIIYEPVAEEWEVLTYWKESGFFLPHSEG